MDQFSSIRDALLRLKPELTEKFHVRHIALFGSIVRSDFNNESDIDILADFSKPIGIEFIDLADYIEAKLNRVIDLVSRSGIKDKYFNAIEKEMIYV